MKNAHVYALIAVLIIAGIAVVLFFSLSKASAQVVANGDTVGVYYTGTLTNGTVFGSNIGQQPLEFTVGSNQIIEGFGQGIIGMKINQSRTITIPVNEAYGAVNPALIVQVPISDFSNNTVTTGMVVTENSTTGGPQVQGVVKAVNATTVTVDFNPVLAGQTLIFNITVVSIQAPAKQ
jgi:peptidylprolyl isomerase